ncbi:MAG: tRNA-dihydrouridine synthase, partial [Anaerolineales bacterium]|nr:tRNA-dihydrouridine synthase [Anaerolineales bacterium]
IIDINMGCSTRKVSGRGAGVGMMPQPELVRDTFSLLTKHLRVPVTGKIRLGWDDDQRNYADIARIMEDNGAALIAMHARTKVQKYGGEADWDEIARLREIVSVPVIGNGDVQTPADIDRMKTHTGCNAVMIGRAAIGNPWIFARRTRESLTFAELLATIRQHQAEMMAYYGRRGISAFRKHLKRYLEDLPLLESLLTPLMMAASAAEVQDLLAIAEQRVSQFAGPPHQVHLAQLLRRPQPDSLARH